MKYETMLPVLRYIINTEGVPEELKEICQREMKITKAQYMKEYMVLYNRGIRRLEERKKQKEEAIRMKKEEEDANPVD